MPNTMHVRVQHAVQKVTIFLLCDSSDACRKIKSRVADALGVDASEVRLSARGKTCEDEALLSDAGIVNDDVLTYALLHEE